ncbi:armadillo repeat-containing protein 2-like isoform X1 [Mytilus galloprovincialis]|uniref:armadillo repeat-containing protein 2-like isoform X1 n=1 Tax=Mytilus galloprovincialis TaxID=29158 RepID=UPI003F7CAB10
MDQKKNKPERPFYIPPKNVPTPSEIISDAKRSIKNPRSLPTKRPFTPRDERRSLFPTTTCRNPDSRPPSAFSLSSKHFDGPESRPVSGARLIPLDHKPGLISASFPEETPQIVDLDSSESTSSPLPPKPPTDPNKTQRKYTRNSRLYSGNSVEESSKTVKTSSLTDLSKQVKSPDSEPTKRVNSGPKERTPVEGRDETQPLPLEERGEGDGKEMPHRAPSSAAVRSPPRSAGSREESRVGSGGSKRTSSAGSTGRTGSAGKREVEETPEEASFYTDHIAPLLEKMTVSAKKKEADHVVKFTDELYAILLKENLLGKNCKRRSVILKTIFKILDLDDPKVLLRLARLILSFKVSGNNLTSVCKLVFKVSRNEKNDPQFLRGDILDLLLETVRNTDPVSSSEALIYCVGAIKFMTGNTKIVKELVKKDCIEALANLLIGINKTNRENSKPNDQLGHILVQLTAAMRNLADASSSRERLLNSKGLESLCYVIDTYTADGDLMLNISRIFSKVTLHTDCCMALITQPSAYKSFIHLLNKQQHKADVVVRVCFILGNMTAKNDDARLRLFQENKSMDALLAIMKYYLDRDIKIKSREKEKETSKQDSSKGNDCEDVLIKTVRVVANMSINEMVGPVLASNQQFVELLLNILECKDVQSSEELSLNTVATINNLSFYNTKTSAITDQQMRIIEVLLKMVLADNMEAMVESSRVFGNLTRQKCVRDYLVANKVDQMMITMLDSGNREVVYIACGVLINFMVDDENRSILKKDGGIAKLVEVLRDFAKTDWELASMVCQILWNYSVKITSTNSCFGEQESKDLNDVLLELLDRECAFEDLDEEDEEMKHFFHDTWSEDFCPVATQLLQRMESYSSDLEPIESPSES